MKTHYKFIIVGSGFGGMMNAINLNKRGESDYILLERRSFMGGTWSQNCYPGAAVDVQSPLYSLSSEPYVWSQMFAEQHELAEYTNYVIDKHSIREKTKLNADVENIEWQTDNKRWIITLVGGEQYSAQIIINASGILSTPLIPNFKGKDLFQGKSFHTNDWDQSYDYKGKRVAIIGSGASAAQVIPAIAPDVKHLHVFQRTPHWVLARPDRVFKPWFRKLLGFKWFYKLLRIAIYCQLEFRVVAFKYAKWLLSHFVEKEAKAFIRKQIPHDEVLRKKVTPDFTLGCKRVILSNTLYPTYCRDNVTLHDKNDGIKAITQKGIMTLDGVEHELDLIIYSTGYDAIDGLISYPVVGKDGTRLQDFWAEYPRAYLGTAMPNFPNLFIMTGPNTSIGHTSALFLMEAQINYINNALDALEKHKATTVEVTKEAESQYTDFIHSEMQETVWQTGGCASWYKTASGKVVAMFPGFSFTFRRWTKRFKMKDHLFE